jgi:hypothetical protein
MSSSSTIDHLSLVSCAQTMLLTSAVINILAVGVPTNRKHDTNTASRWTSYEISNLLSFAVCLISGIHYTHMLYIGQNTYRSVLYSDWLVTVPLLLIECWVLLRNSYDDAANTVWLASVVVLSIVMIMSGYFRTYGLSWICLIGVYMIYVFQYYNNHNTCHEDTPDDEPGRYPTYLIVLFLGLWMGYGIVEMGATSQLWRMRLFSVLDIICKAIFGITIAFMY